VNASPELGVKLGLELKPWRLR